MRIPGEIEKILGKLRGSGFEAYAVGGCVRDLLLGRDPKDWDICTNALPEKIQAIFPDSFYENKFGTVSVKTGSEKENLAVVEVTTFRVDAIYSDKRHPDEVDFTRSLIDDLARRDFTINAMAWGVANNEEKERVIDPFGGQNDLRNNLIRTVGAPDERFDEDALRMMRAVRLAVELSAMNYGLTEAVKSCFTIDAATKQAIKNNAGWLVAIARERTRDELVKIIMTPLAHEGILLLQELNLLQHIMPELVKGIGITQNKHHIYTIFEHGVFSLKFAAQSIGPAKEANRAGRGNNLVVRLAALLHDVAKPQAKRGAGPDATFYNHDIMGARAAARILQHLRFDNDTIERVANLIRHHMFVYDIGAVTPAGVRRLLARVGPANISDLIALRVADRLGSGVPKAQPYRLRHFQYMVERVQHDPISVKMLKINGRDIMRFLRIEPGPKIGAILDVLLAEVIDEPAKNNREHLSARVRELDGVDLSVLRQMAKERIKEEKEEEDKLIKAKHRVG